MNDITSVVASAVPFGAETPDLPAVAIGPDEGRVVDEAIVALKGDPDLYQRGFALVTVVEDREERGGVRRQGGQTIVPVPAANLRERLTRCARILKQIETMHGTIEAPCHPPAWLIQALHQRMTWDGIPRLRAVIEYPAMLPDGSILSEPGYHQESGLLLAPGGDFPRIPLYPNAQDVKEAVALLDDLLADFPFATPPHRAAWQAGLLTILSRHAHNGPAPMILLDKNTRGAGGSLACDLCGLIVSGKPMARMTETEDQEEMRKRITAVLMAGDGAVLMDNVTKALGGGALDALLTGMTWRDRILGQSAMTPELPALTTWFASGNNVQLAGDMIRRVLHIRLESPDENPETRTNFRHPDLRTYTLANRERLLVAGLVILRGYAAAGWPDQHLAAWGSFEEWSRIVRGALVWAGLPDPGETRAGLMATADREGSALGLLLTGLLDMFPGGRRITVAETMRRLNDPSYEDSWPELREAVAELATGTNGRPSGKILAWQFKHLRGRIADGQRLELEAESRRAGNFWKVERVATRANMATFSSHVISDGEFDMGEKTASVAQVASSGGDPDGLPY